MLRADDSRKRKCGKSAQIKDLQYLILLRRSRIRVCCGVVFQLRHDATFATTNFPAGIFWPLLQQKNLQGLLSECSQMVGYNAVGFGGGVVMEAIN